MPGVLGIFTGEDVATDKIGNLICGWMIHSKDGSPMKGRPTRRWRRARCAMSATMSRSWSPRRWRRRATPPRSQSTIEELPAVVDTAKAIGAKTVVHDEAPDNSVFDWHLGDKDATEKAFKAAKHVTKLDLVNNRLVPNAMEPRGRRRLRRRRRHLHALHHQPEPACRAARDVGLHRHRAREQAARDRAGCRRRLRLEDLHLCRGDGLRLGGQEGRAAGEVDGDRTEAFLTDAHGRDHSPTPSWRPTRTARSWPAGEDHRQSRRLLSTFSSSVPTYLYATLLSGQYNIPAIYAR
jgi:carbon-monoxide dehydrogenase large subunit